MYIMALQVWLPLNGNLKNQGLAGNLTFTNVSASNTTIDNNGKIGKCYKNNSFSAGGLISNTTINLGSKQSMFCWFKFDSLTSSSSLGGAMIGQHRYPSNTGMGLTIKYVSSTTGYLSINTGNGSSRTYNTYCNTTLLSAGNWYHGGFTYDGTTIKIYLNGICENTINLSGMSVPADYIMIFNWSFSSSSGNSLYGGYKLNGSLNDVRIYDHCLSPKEVHSISQALVLHYSLDNIQSDYSEKLLIEPDGSKWIHIFHHNNPASNLFSSSNTWANGVYESDDKWFDVYSIVSQLSSYEFLAKIRTTASSSEIKYRWVQAKSPLIATYNDVKPASVTRITTSGYTDSGYGGLYILNSNTHMVTANSSNGNWWGATGCWTQYSGGIPSYGGQVVTSGCADLYVRIPDISSLKIFDNSGYQNDGTIAGSLQIVNSEARYRKCSKVTDTGRIIYPFPHLQVFSYSLWFKRSRVSYSNREMLGTGWYGISMELNTNNTLTFRHQLTSGTFDVITTKTFTSTSDWYHITLTRDAAGVSKIYVNGVLDKSGTNTNQINYTSSTAELFTYSNTSYQFQGCISDFRIYATALSAADVAALHNVGAIIDNGANMHTYEYYEIESTTPKVHRTGVTDSSAIIEPDTITNASFSKTGIIKSRNFYEV